MDALSVKAVLDYPVYLKLKSEKDKAKIAADTINKELGTTSESNPNSENGASAVPHADADREGPGDEVYNEQLVKDAEDDGEHGVEDGGDSDNQDSIDNGQAKNPDEENFENDDSHFQFLSRMPLSSGYEKKAAKLVELIGLDPREDVQLLDGTSYTNDEIKTIFYQLYVKKTNNYHQNVKLLSFLKSMADRNMFNLIKNKSMLANFKTPWWCLL